MKTKTELKAEWDLAESKLREAGRSVSLAETVLRQAREAADAAKLAYQSADSNSANV